MTTNLDIADSALLRAARAVGVDSTGAELIRDGSHVMYRLPGGVAARVGRPGTAQAARREVEVSRWLATSGLVVTRALDGMEQPTVVDGCPVTWWRLLPEHRSATPAELGAVLRTLHSVPVPESPLLPISDPFAGLDQRITAASALDSDDRTWLAEHVGTLRERYGRLSLGEPRHVIHGDAWQDNVAVPSSGPPILLDLESVAIGHPDWDVVSLAVDHTDFARLTARDYREFVDAYGGYDITGTAGFRVWADLQELRWTCFVISKSDDSPSALREARHRIACLRGEIIRPWTWSAF